MTSITKPQMTDAQRDELVRIISESSSMTSGTFTIENPYSLLHLYLTWVDEEGDERTARYEITGAGDITAMHELN